MIPLIKWPNRIVSLIEQYHKTTKVYKLFSGEQNKLLNQFQILEEAKHQMTICLSRQLVKVNLRDI